MTGFIDYFPAVPAIDYTTGNVVPGAQAQVFARGDATYSTPLTITDLSGVAFPGNTITAGPTGIFPDFLCAGYTEVTAKSGSSLTTPIESYLGRLMRIIPFPNTLDDGLVMMTSAGAWIAALITGDGSVIPSAAGQPDGTAMETLGGAWALGVKKAPLDSPALTGTPTAPTQSAGNNTTRLATTAFVQAAVAALVASAPSTLDTLNELATALGDDPNFATTMTTALGLKAPLASPALTGSPTAPTQTAGDSSTKLATTAFVQGAVAALQGAYVGINAQTGTTYSAVLGDVGKLVTCTNAAAITVTLPKDATQAIPVGSQITFQGRGAGKITFAAESGATADGTPTLITRAQYSAVTAIKIASNTWTLVGDLG